MNHIKSLSFLLLTTAFFLAGCQQAPATPDIEEPPVTPPAAMEPTETFVIDSQLKDCVGVGPMKCMVINGNFFYDKIEGFEFQPGFKYELKVKKEPAFAEDTPAGIPADANKYKYILSEMVSKEADIPENCTAWFDGCNNCTRAEGGVAACTRKFCPAELMKEPKCLEFAEE